MISKAELRKQLDELMDKFDGLSLSYCPVTEEVCISWRHGRHGSEYRWNRTDDKSYQAVIHDIACDASKLGLINYYEAALLTAWVRDVHFTGIEREGELV